MHVTSKSKTTILPTVISPPTEPFKLKVPIVSKAVSNDAQIVGPFMGYYLLFPIGLVCVFFSTLYFAPGANTTSNPVLAALIFFSLFLAGVALLGYRNRLTMSRRYVRIHRSVLGFTLSDQEIPVSELGAIWIGTKSYSSFGAESGGLGGSSTAYYIYLQNKQGHEVLGVTDYCPGLKSRGRKKLARVLRSADRIRDITGIKVVCSMSVWKDINKWGIKR